MEQDDRLLPRWAESLPKNALDFCRITLEVLRQHHTDVWNGVRFFITVNGIVLAAATAIIGGSRTDPIAPYLLMLLSIAGIGITWTARRILTAHRNNYLETLLRKTLMEQEFGLYDLDISGLDFSLPWKVPKEYVQNLRSDPARWLADQNRRRGTVSRRLFQVYEAVLFLHVAVLVSALVWVFFY